MKERRPCWCVCLWAEAQQALVPVALAFPTLTAEAKPSLLKTIPKAKARLCC